MSLPISKSASSKDKADSNLAPADPGYVRLHISPLDADLLNVVVPSSVLPEARNASFRTLDTFPDRPYGFVDLPIEAAEKLRKKLNGATLRGNKMKVERARPPPPEYVPDPEVEASAKKRKKIVIDFDGSEIVSPKKRKKDRDVMQGIVLEDDRKVKRGWTVTAEQARKSAKTKVRTKKGEKEDKKNKEAREVRSKYTDKQECLIKTVMPAGKPMPETKVGAKSKKRSRDGKSNREIIAHEYEHAIKFPTFLRDAPKPTTAPAAKKAAESETSDSDSSESDSSESESGNSDSEDETKEELSQVGVKKMKEVEDAKAQATPATQAPVEEPTDTSSSEGSSSEESDDENEKSDAEMCDGPGPTVFAPSTELDPSKLDERPNTSGSMKSLTIKIPPPPSTPGKVHPLEALYKKNPDSEAASSTAATAEPFSFFGGSATVDGGSDNESEYETPRVSRHTQLPMTPFTRQDFEARGLRSAAPTPDTAHPNRTRRFFPDDEDQVNPDDEDDYEEDVLDSLASPMAQRDAVRAGGAAAMAGAGADTSAGKQEESTEFQTWFWENRSELNRSWMRRRKTVAKERRMKDNKTRGFRGA
ncbi:hypothetical protein CFO_g4238 [Ceratocystis platani]|uniref:Suppressor protein SRP40 n=1 Tax=Ceratocystis fimbriata f. sp. platani TaxID=88771 RepID=A0A0F8CRL4_CERFI|nr:hypothetical protein CFO_g4238 [Ceratocystis platani]